MLLLLLLALVVTCHSYSYETDQWKTSLFMNKLTLVTFYVAIPQNQQGVKMLERYILKYSSNIDSPAYGHHLTTQEICKLTMGKSNDFKLVTKWMIKQNIKCTKMCDSLKCTGSVRQINKALGTDLQKFQNRKTGQTLFKSPTSYQVPTQLATAIDFIEGLSNRLRDVPVKKRNMKAATSTPDKGVVSREVLMHMYNHNDTSSSSSVSVGAMEYLGGNGFSDKNLMIDQVANGVPKNPISDDHIVGTNNMPDGESTLDVQVMYWSAHKAQLWYEDYSEPTGGWMYSWSVDFLRRTDYPQVVSVSWGWSEVQQCTVAKCHNETSQQYVARVNVEFMKIVARGTTILVASGDAGSPGRTNEFCDSTFSNSTGWDNINAIFPGSSPWVLSVGATFVVAGNKTFKYTTPICTNVTGITCAMGTEEQMTTYSQTQWTSGSGSTRWTTTPEWQCNVVQQYLSKKIQFPDQKYYNKNGRFYPDVSAFGHNCVIYSWDGWTTEDGTSCASPIFAGIVTQLNSFQQARGRGLLGFANPLFYKMYSDDQSTFHDITVGNSTCTESMCCGSQFGFLATTGWDTVSGLGTANVGRMKAYLASRS